MTTIQITSKMKSCSPIYCIQTLRLHSRNLFPVSRTDKTKPQCQLCIGKVTTPRGKILIKIKQMRQTKATAAIARGHIDTHKVALGRCSHEHISIILPCDNTQSRTLAVTYLSQAQNTQFYATKQCLPVKLEQYLLLVQLSFFRQQELNLPDCLMSVIQWNKLHQEKMFSQYKVL